MVSFQCDACQDVVKKPKLDNHYGRCHSSFTCIDCSTTFAGPKEYKAHTSCISEAQKYEKDLYRGNKNGHATARPNQNQNRTNGTYGSNGPNGNIGNNQSQNNWGNRGPGRYSPSSYQSEQKNNWNRNPRYRRSMGTGSNDEPLGSNVKMMFSPPNETATPEKEEAAGLEKVEPTQGEKPKTNGRAKERDEATKPTQATETTADVDMAAQADVKNGPGAANAAPTATQKKPRKPKKKRSPPPPGETRGEHRKRKKQEKLVRKAEKLKKRAQDKAARRQAQQDKAQGQSQSTTAVASEPSATTSAPVAQSPPAENIVTVPQATVNGTAEKKRKRKKEDGQEVDRPSKKSRGSTNNVDGDGDVEMQPVDVKSKKSKKSKKGDNSSHPEPNSALPNGTGVNGHTNGEEVAETKTKSDKKSKKRKREEEDVGGREMVEEITNAAPKSAKKSINTEGLTFKERAKVEKKARKEEKRAKKALLENSNTISVGA